MTLTRAAHATPSAAVDTCATPIALITLIDADRQWFKSAVGITVQETARNVAFCNDAIRQPDLYVIPDATRDGRGHLVPRVAISSSNWSNVSLFQLVLPESMAASRASFEG